MWQLALLTSPREHTGAVANSISWGAWASPHPLTWHTCTYPHKDSTGKGAFRHDIEGLRALAVRAVVLYHCGVFWLGGGFTGVDVFFVISGFLITSHLPAGCLFGDRSSLRRILLAGDSHAGLWFAAVQEAAQQRGMQLTAWTKSWCQ